MYNVYIYIYDIKTRKKTMGEENEDVSKSKKYVTASDKHQILTVSSFVPFDIRRSKWQTFVRKQLVEHQVAYIRDEIISVAATRVLEKYYFEKKSFVFVRESVNLAWLQLFDVSIDFQQLVSLKMRLIIYLT